MTVEKDAQKVKLLVSVILRDCPSVCVLSSPMPMKYPSEVRALEGICPVESRWSQRQQSMNARGEGEHWRMSVSQMCLVVKSN